MMQGTLTLFVWLTVACSALPQDAWALANSTRAQLEQLEAKLRQHIDDGFMVPAKLTPLTLVETSSNEEDPEALTNAALPLFSRVLRGPILVCDSCRGSYEEGPERTAYSSGFVDLQKVRDVYRGRQEKPVAALWLRQAEGVLTLRMVSLESGEVLYADTIDGKVDWSARSLRNFTSSQRAERGSRGDVIVHGHIDIGLGLLGGGAHVGYSLMQQWGSNNQYLSGLSFNFSDPIFGVGINHFQILPSLDNTILGAKLLFSLPEALSSLGDGDGDSDGSVTGDSLITLVLMAKYPLFSQPEKFYFNVFISTAGLVGCGLSW